MWLTIGTSLLGGIFGGFGSRSAARARNAQMMANYKYRMQKREREWYQQLSIWGAKRTKYYQDLDENFLAAQRGYTQAQTGLNNAYAQAVQTNEKALIGYLQKHGKASTQGRTGRSIDRINTLDIAELERVAGKTEYALTKSYESYKLNVSNIRNAARSHRNQLFQNVAFAPVPDVTPPAPVMESTSPWPSIFQGLGQGLLSWNANRIGHIGTPYSGANANINQNVYRSQAFQNNDWLPNQYQGGLSLFTPNN